MVKWFCGVVVVFLGVLILLVVLALDRTTTATAATSSLNTEFRTHCAAQAEKEKSILETLAEIKADVKSLLRAKPSQP